MLAIFRNYNPYVVLLLLILTIVVKLGYWITPDAVTIEGNMLIYNVLWGKVQGFLQFSNFTWGIIAILSLFVQALYVNNIANRFDLFTNMTYLPAFTYIILGSIIPSWNSMGPYMVLSWFVIGILDNALKLYHTSLGRFTLVNLGILIGASALLLPELAILIIFGFIAISIFRAFNVGDWLAYILGLITPFYILFAYLFFQNQLSLFSVIFNVDLAFITKIASPTKLVLAISMIVLSLVIGSIYLMQFMSRMVMEHQKYWTIVIVLFITIVIGGVLTLRNDWSNWLILLPTLSLIVNNAWLEYKRKWIATTLCYLLIICSLYFQWT